MAKSTKRLTYTQAVRVGLLAAKLDVHPMLARSKRSRLTARREGRHSAVLGSLGLATASGGGAEPVMVNVRTVSSRFCMTVTAAVSTCLILAQLRSLTHKLQEKCRSGQQVLCCTANRYNVLIDGCQLGDCGGPCPPGLHEVAQQTSRGACGKKGGGMKPMCCKKKLESCHWVGQQDCDQSNCK